MITVDVAKSGIISPYGVANRDSKNNTNSHQEKLESSIYFLGLFYVSMLLKHGG